MVFAVGILPRNLPILHPPGANIFQMNDSMTAPGMQKKSKLVLCSPPERLVLGLVEVWASMGVAGGKLIFASQTRQVSTSTHGGAKMKHIVHWLVASGAAAALGMKSIMCGTLTTTRSILCRTPPETEEGASKDVVKLGRQGRNTVEMTQPFVTKSLCVATFISVAGIA